MTLSFGGQMTEVLLRSLSFFEALDTYHQSYCIIGGTATVFHLQVLRSKKLPGLSNPNRDLLQKSYSKPDFPRSARRRCGNVVNRSS